MRTRLAALALLSLVLGTYVAVGRASEGDSAAEPDLGKARKLVFYWDVPRDIVALTDGGLVPIIRYPSDIRTFRGTAAENQLLLGVLVRDERDEVVGIASELETFPKPYDMTMAHDTTWTLQIPGRGALIGHELEKVTPEYIKLLESITASGKPWTGSYEAQSTVGPASNGMGMILGGTGEFEGARGYLIEENHFRAIDTTKQTYDVRNRMTFYLTNAVESE